MLLMAWAWPPGVPIRPPTQPHTHLSLFRMACVLAGRAFVAFRYYFATTASLPSPQVAESGTFAATLAVLLPAGITLSLETALRL